MKINLFSKNKTKRGDKVYKKSRINPTEISPHSKDYNEIDPRPIEPHEKKHK